MRRILNVKNIQEPIFEEEDFLKILVQKGTEHFEAVLLCQKSPFSSACFA